MKITYLNGPNAGTRFEISTGGASIGRETDNSLQLPIGGVSRYHARIEYETGIWKLQDLGSTNGTFLNGHKIDGAAVMSNGDVFSIGEQQFRVEITPGTTPVDDKPGQTAETQQNAEGGNTFSFHFGPSQPKQPQVSDTNEQPDAKQKEPAKPVASGTGTQAADTSFDNLFGQKDTPSETSANTGKQLTTKKKKITGNILFVLALVALVVGGFMLFMYVSKGTAPGTQTQKKQKMFKNPFAFYYERQDVVLEGQPNVFKVIISGEFGYAREDFETAEDGTMKPQKRFFVKFTLCDLANKRNTGKTLGDKAHPIEREKLKALNDKLAKFVSAPHEKTEDSETKSPSYERLVICDGDGGNVVDVYYNNDKKKDFNQDFIEAKEILSDFLEDISPEYPLSLKPANEVLADARDAYNKGMSHGNVTDSPRDLKDALFEFQRAVWFYSQFELTPNSDDSHRYIEAQGRLSKLQEELDRKYEMLRGNARSEQSKGNYDDAIEMCNTALEYLTPNTEKYNVIYELRQNIEAKRNRIREGAGK